MKNITVQQGLDLPLKGAPEQVIREGAPVDRVALVAEDYLGLKPTMLVREGDRVKLGQPLFTDKKNPGFSFTSPGSGRVEAIHRGPKRRFDALVVALEGEEEICFEQAQALPPEQHSPESIRELLQQSGLWTSLRSRPFGRIPRSDSRPSSLFVTALDTNPLAPDPEVIIAPRQELFVLGLRVLVRMLAVPLHLCLPPASPLATLGVEGVQSWSFSGPHPAGLPSTHIHFIDPVHENKEVWQLCYQEVIRIGALFHHGRLQQEQVVALGGEDFHRPGLVRTRLGASLRQLCSHELAERDDQRLLSGTVLDGRPWRQADGYLGRYHRQLSVLREGSGRSLFGWLAPGRDRFSVTGLFLSAFSAKGRLLPMMTAAWGGRRAIFPLDVYERVMPLDIIPLPLLKALAVGDSEKAAALGCLELIEEDLALCSFVCPGKNEFGPMLRQVLTSIEQEG
ncbi:Na(+)-translocating NADH-quinone reductase subunit A [Desulfogranum mediterraneum]|uniref:Na(+)-translocating NADH-quinone reductase subunit A n=1 Tax=Desulfogranum mediterraneum TaxID=160661 RepID=UPI0004295C82|nr:Na(+)-translocating NADH-quinone reductase subunit A [Desulfogranum mediterraneum]